VSDIILVTNDDGVHAAGLDVLARALAELGQVYVVAPDRERSAVGHALTLHRPLRVEEVGARRYAVNGMPSDCVNLAVLGLLPERPVLVVSGVNHGSNLGDDVTYSGTVSAAMEAALLGVPAIAISQVDPDGPESFAHAGAVARLVVGRALVEGMPRKTLLNVNVPPGQPKGVKVTRLGHRVYSEKAIQQNDPRGKTYYWIGAGPPAWEVDEGSDMAAIHDGWVSVTPLHMDLTHYGALRAMESWEGGLTALLRKRPT
jgi:5'-nucleotidase